MAKIYMRSPAGEVFTTAHPEYHKDCERLSVQKGMDARRAYCIAKLREFIEPGQKIYCILRNVSRSGMSRVVSLYVVQNGELRNINSLASDVLLWGETNEGVKVSGCGMDAGFHAVYTLGRYLFPEGFGIEGVSHNGTEEVSARPASPTQAAEMVANGFRFRGRNGDSSGWDNDGGYALRHDWV